MQGLEPALSELTECLLETPHPRTQLGETVIAIYNATVSCVHLAILCSLTRYWLILEPEAGSQNELVRDLPQVESLLQEKCLDGTQQQCLYNEGRGQIMNGELNCMPEGTGARPYNQYLGRLDRQL